VKARANEKGMHKKRKRGVEGMASEKSKGRRGCEKAGIGRCAKYTDVINLQTHFTAQDSCAAI
jgi:hypothetical protein